MNSKRCKILFEKGFHPTPLNFTMTIAMFYENERDKKKEK